MSGKNYFFLKLNPPRASFTTDMTTDELATMQKHTVYWQSCVDDGTVIVLGPVADPKGGYGISVLALDSEEQLNELVADDPANGLCQYEVYPMMATVKE